MTKKQKKKDAKDAEIDELKKTETVKQEKTAGTDENPEKDAKKTAEVNGTNETPAAEGLGGDCSANNEEDLSEKIAELEEKCRDWQNQYLRKAADFNNYRKRMLKEKQEAIDYANSNLLLDLVQVLDDFDRAIEAGTKQQSDKANSAFAEGIIMIKNQMLSMLDSKYGLAYYPSKGEIFDPNIHEAVSMLPSDTVKEPTIGEEIMKGYKLRDRIIRHAKVMVFMPKEEKSENSSSNEKDGKDKEQEKTAKPEETADKTDKK